MKKVQILLEPSCPFPAPVRFQALNQRQRPLGIADAPSRQGQKFPVGCLALPRFSGGTDFLGS